METTINAARRFKKGDIVKLHGYDQQYVVLEDETENDFIYIKGISGKEDQKTGWFICLHNESPLKKGDVVLVRAVDAVDDNAYKDGVDIDDSVDSDDDECDDCTPIVNSLDIIAIQQIATYASRLAVMSKPDLIDLAQSITTEDGTTAYESAQIVANADGLDSPTRADYVQAIMSDMLTKQYGN